MKRNQLILVWDVHPGMIFRHSDLGRSMIAVVKTRPTLNKQGTFYEFQAQDLLTFKIHSFGAAYPLSQGHPSIEYIGEAAN